MVWGTTEESFFQNIRLGDSPSYAVGDALRQLERTPSRSDFLKFAQAEWTRTYRDNASARAALFTRVQSEQPCSPASSHGRLSFRPVIVTTAHAHAVKPFATVLSWDEAAIYSLNSTDCG